MPPARTAKLPSPSRLIGYARVSTEDQGTDPQSDELRAAGCETVLEEHASGADRGRPVLAGLLREIGPGETLVVVRLDRLARSVSHLLAVIEQLEAGAAHFRSLRDPIDTTTPQGMFSLQVLGAVAQLERALIAERTKAGLTAARRRGRVGDYVRCRASDIILPSIDCGPLGCVHDGQHRRGAAEGEVCDDRRERAGCDGTGGGGSCAVHRVLGRTELPISGT